MPSYDNEITIVEKGTRPSTTIVPKGSASYSIVEKGTRPSTTIVPKPEAVVYLLTEAGDNISTESGNLIRTEV